MNKEFLPEANYTEVLKWISPQKKVLYLLISSKLVFVFILAQSK